MTDARVELLTAEVRTLVVGSRQITLSVAKQLDTTPLHDLTVMGRVRIWPDKKTVIGRAPTGALAVAFYERRPRAEAPYLDLAEDLGGERPQLCDSGRWNYRGDEIRLSLDGQPFRLWYKDVDWYPHASHEGPCYWHASDDTKHLIRHAITAWVERIAAENAIHNAAANAPLIVLAGLK